MPRRLGAVLTLIISTQAMAQGGASMYRYPDISGDEIVFVYGNDLWRVPVEGGTALPLASPAGAELMPRFSPDGSRVAFVGNYDGNRDLYHVAVDGGMPVRVTHHPTTEMLSDWTADGDLLFTANGLSGVPRAERPFRVSSEGGLPEAMVVPYGANATLDASGTKLAYTPWQRDRRTWKRYRGGLASDVWIVDLEDGTSTQVTDWEGTDTLPMWHGDTLYYLSDRGDEHRLNLWSWDAKSKRHRQVTAFSDYDVKWPAIGPEEGPAQIVFQYGPGLWVYDDASKTTNPVSINVPGATATLRPQLLDMSEDVQSWDISPTGKRAVVQARGDVWTLPAKNGSPRNLTRTSGHAERTPTWSPDGKWIAYFSDEPGEYELFIRPSDGSGEPRRLTDDMGPFKSSIWWAPDSESIVYADKTGTARRVVLEDGTITEVGRSAWDEFPYPSFSHDSRWITWAAGDEDSMHGRVHLHDTTTGETYVVTDPMFNDSSPAFDRKGDWLYFTSSRRFAPEYSDLDTTWVYNDSGVLMAVPLREDVEYPWLEESDEEEWDEDEEDEETDEDSDEEGSDEEGSEDEAADEDSADDSADEDSAEAPTDPVTGTWSMTAELGEMGDVEMTVTLELGADGAVTGTIETPMFTGDLTGTFDSASGRIELLLSIPEGPTVEIIGTIEDGTFTGEATSSDMPEPAVITGSRQAASAEAGEEGEDGEEEAETVEIDLEGFEQRAIRLPVSPGSFGNLMVNHKNQLLYVRGTQGIKMFDINDDGKSEKSAGSGGGFYLSADGKKMLVPSGGSARIRGAGAGSGGDRVVTSPMIASVDPRQEWRQVVTDAWRIQRDYFYDAGLHGVDWGAVLEAYLPMVDQATTRSDVSYIIGEMISELNAGHAYYWGGDGEAEPSLNVGLLGIDWELVPGSDSPEAEDGTTPAHYRVGRIIEGGDWDVDARNPLRRSGVDIEEGDVILAVNGIDLDPTVDPYAPFIGYAGKTVTLTVADEPGAEETREVVVKTLGSERSLRYRDWIESRRRHVEEATDGEVGYIYVPNTGRDGQSDLVRQFYGQAHKPALIIDERWNGGGQIPTRFIEMLNRPVTNYWARRDSKDWTWPPDSHQGPKAMLINGHAGSGGDMFPWLFKHNELGPVIGTRTWGGLIGISGNPGMIDGSYTAVPTFGFYETDGTWGVEGHGVDPDIEVIDDPALMLNGEDPQLDRAIEEMRKALKTSQRYEPAKRPASPDRSGMGIPKRDH